jgi:hypothetical protein
VIDVDFDNDDLVALEAVVRDAGNLMHASQDLRPRVLEQARMCARQEKRNRVCALLFAAIVFLYSGLFGSSELGRQCVNTVGVNATAENSPMERSPSFISSDELIASAYAGWEGPVATREWSLVDAFAELQWHRARMLRRGM